MITKEELGWVITDMSVLKKQYILRDGFAFTCLMKPNVFDALIVRESLETDSLDHRFQRDIGAERA